MIPKVAVVGCAHWGKNLVRNFAELKALKMVCEVSEDGFALAQSIAPSANVVRSFQDVLSSDVEGVVIATPAETHYLLAKQVLASGQGRVCRKATGHEL